MTYDASNSANPDGVSKLLVTLLAKPFSFIWIFHACWKYKYGIAHIIFNRVGIQILLHVSDALPSLKIVLSLQTVKTPMKRRLTWHFDWVSTVCQCTYLSSW